ncbi:hypothetical protein [Thauera humireducens]|uniref:hypothetical protein n=1 Tax=Thauera humireducens TaxID=1134435 RepID=UPI00312012CF
MSVPWGKPETLPAGAYALITQRLGELDHGDVRRQPLPHCRTRRRRPRTGAAASGTDARTGRGRVERRGRRAERVEAAGHLLRPEIPIDIVVSA